MSSARTCEGLELVERVEVAKAYLTDTRIARIPGVAPRGPALCAFLHIAASSYPFEDAISLGLCR